MRDNGSAMAAMFSCLLYLGEGDRAKEWAERAVLIDPDNLIMRYNLACDLAVEPRRSPRLPLAMLRTVLRPHRT